MKCDVVGFTRYLFFILDLVWLLEVAMERETLESKSHFDNLSPANLGKLLNVSKTWFPCSLSMQEEKNIYL